MNYLTNLKELSYKIATLKNLGKQPGGQIVASLIAIPILLIGRAIYHLHSSSFYWLVFIFFTVTVIIMQLAHTLLAEEENPSIFVISKTVGIILAFISISLHWDNWKIILIGFAFFFILNLLKPIFLLIDKIKKINNLPGVAGLLIIDSMFGLLTNLILRIALLLIE